MTGDRSERFDRDALVAVLQEAGAVFRGKDCRCPFHEDKRASAGIYQTQGGVWRFKCHSCDAAGDVFDIRARVRGVPLADVLPKSGDDAQNREREYARMPQNQRTPVKTYPALTEIAANTGGRVQTVYEYSPDFVVVRVIGPDGHKAFRQCHRDGNFWTWGAPPKPWPLYGRERIGDTEDPVIVVEGEKCVDALRAVGMVAVTSPCGAGKAKCADWEPLRDRDCVLWPDHDDPGRAHMVDVAAILAKVAAHVRVIDPARLELPPKGDAADLLELWVADSVESKRRAIRDIIERAQPLTPAGGLVRLIEDTISGARQAIPLPWVRVSRLARPLLPATITLLCGAPGAGKSFMLLEAAFHLHRMGVRVSMFALEETRADSLLRLLAQLAEDARLLDPDFIRDNPEATRAALAEHQSELDAFAPCIFDAPDSQPTLDDLAAWTRERAAEGCRVIICDPISVADMGPEPWNTATRFMVDTGRAIRGTGASLILAAHPKKGAGIGGLVDLDSVAGGAAFVRLAQSVLWLERHAEEHTSTCGGMCGPHKLASNRTLHLLKTRNGPGQGARLAFDFDGDTLQFRELGLIQAEPRKRESTAPVEGAIEIVEPERRKRGA